MANENFSDPYISCCFFNDDLLFVDLFHNYDFINWHFVFDTNSNTIVGPIIKHKMDFESKKNFPWNCFYSDENKELYVFFRHGDSMIINCENICEYTVHRMTDMDLGQMFLVN